MFSSSVKFHRDKGVSIASTSLLVTEVEEKALATGVT
jgi:hypothetical protein